jgi:PAS domain S-box-containing protein
VARAEALQATAYINKPASDYHDVIRTVVGFVQTGARYREKSPTPAPDEDSVPPTQALSGDTWRLAFELSADPSLILDSHGRIVEANAAIQRFFKRERRQLLGRSIDVLIAERSRGPVRDGMAAELLRGVGSPGSTRELVGLSSDARELPVEMRVRTFVDAPDTLMIATFVDISERKVLEERTRELGRSNAELEHFAHVISHDLQEPVRMVASYTRLLAEDYRAQLDENAQLYIHFAQSGAEHMQCLIRDLLAYSRVGTRRRSLAAVSVTECLTLATSSLRMAIDEASAVVSSDPLPEVNGDRTQVTELLQNLIGNALKFRRDVPPEIHVSAERVGRMWQFSVRDNGIGIQPAYVEEVFQVFRRLHGRNDYPGTGIGLAICRRIVEQFGGRIWVESESGKGSTFHFTLPALDD